MNNFSIYILQRLHLIQKVTLAKSAQDLLLFAGKLNKNCQKFSKQVSRKIGTVESATDFVARATDFVAYATNFVACATDFVARFCGMCQWFCCAKMSEFGIVSLGKTVNANFQTGLLYGVEDSTGVYSKRMTAS